MKMRTFWAAAAVAVGSCVISIAILGVPGAENGGGTLKVYNWGEYIDEDVITQFEDETGISVIYDVFETNEETTGCRGWGAIRCSLPFCGL